MRQCLGSYHSASESLRLLTGILVFCLLLPPAYAAKNYVSVTSDPPGASVEIDGIVVGTTPYQVEVPGGYLHGTKSVFGKLLRHQVRLRLLLDGYLPTQADLAIGPTPWIALNGTYHGDYWLLKADHFHFTLERAATTFTGTVEAKLGSPSALTPTSKSSTEDVVRLASTAVLLLKGSDGFGSGFLVTETGVAVTNAHVARGQNEIVAVANNGQKFQAKVVYVDPNLDLALVKLDGRNFAHLVITDISGVHPGASVLAIGTPSEGFQNTVTRGIVSGLGPMPKEPGTWIQTDAAINPGNSGGPLLNSSGEVIGITTQKPFVSGDGRPLQGIGFALSGSDLLSVLSRFFPNIAPSSATAPEFAQAPSFGKITVSADSDAAEIYVDGKFVGNVPSSLRLSSGSHKIVVTAPSRTTWERELEVLKDSDINLKVTLPK